MQQKINAVIIGPGNIGTDLLYKALRSQHINPVLMVGVDASSEGLKRAKKLGLEVATNGLAEATQQLQALNVKIAFDATSAYAHRGNAKLLAELGIKAVDLTPAAMGPFCVPSVNLQELDPAQCDNVNMVTCGGQATIPMVAAVSQIQNVDYAEIIATVSSRSVGPGTRQNIDEFTRTTASAIESVGKANKGKAIIIINPAEPPLIMRDTVHCLCTGAPDQQAITESVHAMLSKVQAYVPGYRLKNGPVFDGNKVSIYLEVEGQGDFLPHYAGNLDIMTAAALHTAELIAQQALA
ncbi:Acetaldehyde dehydrogenase (acetylating) [Saliniradius amylolyticus]|uniref:Acetaldehyde dehydrogenase n=1 Tax=Saliniradius amylolyticus TaxID=2183582 RepID=A0A2S2E6M2_9ALTE|nr:acetaldehyde dehydrogenase (acetylating) [Saliniradius amylolyticus]AWL13182.1 Acetaldehyde dehydrogenase (acetylating) [Saliniradius amylolyticus]